MTGTVLDPTIIGIANRKRPRTKFGEFLRRAREDKGLTQRELTIELGFAPNTINMLEVGAAQGIRIDSLARLIKYFGWDANQVMAFYGTDGLKGLQGISSEITSRPVLRELFEIARTLDDRQIAMLKSAAASWTAKAAS